MSLVNNLLSTAATVRDASQEGENTALRVGGLLVSLIQAINSVLPGKTIDADHITMTASASNIVINFRTKDADGQTSNKDITIPAGTTTAAGLITPADRQAIAAAHEALGNSIANSRIAGSSVTTNTTNVEVSLVRGDNSKITFTLPLADCTAVDGWKAGLITGADLNKIRQTEAEVIAHRGVTHVKVGEGQGDAYSATKGQQLAERVTEVETFATEHRGVTHVKVGEGQGDAYSATKGHQLAERVAELEAERDALGIYPFHDIVYSLGDIFQQDLEDERSRGLIYFVTNTRKFWRIEAMDEPEGYQISEPVLMTDPAYNGATRANKTSLFKKAYTAEFYTYFDDDEDLTRIHL